MFARIFGGTDEEQMKFLETRSIITLAALVVGIVGGFFVSEAPAIIAVVMLFVWGWNVVKRWFGVTTVAAIFANNIVIGVVLFVLYLMVAYFAGIVFAVLGVGRWIYLKATHRGGSAAN